MNPHPPVEPQSGRAAAPETARDRQRRSEFLDITAHDLRSPLANIRSYAEIASSPRVGATLPPAVRHALEVIRRNADRALLLVQDFIDSRKGDLDSLDLARTVVPLGDLWSELASRDVSDRLRERGIELRVEVEPGLPDLRLDRRRVARVLQLLLDRAAARAPEGSRVVAFARAEPPWIAVGVADGGPAPWDDDAAHLFDRESAVLRERQLASGLALPLSRAVARAHGGEARVRPEGGLSAVALLLPAGRGPD